MGFMYRFQQFMTGRNGFDSLTSFLLFFSLSLSFVNVFVWNYWVNLSLYLVQLFIFAYAVFRFLSRNLYKRSRENQGFLKIFRSVKNFFVLTKNRFRDIKTHRYRKCKYCKATLRLKRRRGKHTVRCPKCREEFKVNILI